MLLRESFQEIEASLGRAESRLSKRLRSLQGLSAAEEVVGELNRFLKPIGAEVYNKSLPDASEDLIALHCLQVPNTLHRTLLSTNPIETSY